MALDKNHTNNPMHSASTVILLHGLGRSQFDMFLMSRRLCKLLPHTSILRFDYNSRRFSLQESAQQLRVFIDSQQIDGAVSFVGHSLGGIVVRSLDAMNNSPAHLHRLVTLGSPHLSATAAKLLARYKSARLIFGPVLAELATLELPPIPKQLEIGCVIGGLRNSWGFLPFFGEDNDGLVLAREAHLPACRDSIIVPQLHGLMPFSALNARLAAQFLSTGRFLSD